jgi:hypothetical protein
MRKFMVALAVLVGVSAAGFTTGAHAATDYSNNSTYSASASAGGR